MVWPMADNALWYRRVRRTAVAATVLLLALMWAACGGGDQSGQPTVSTPATTTAPLQFEASDALITLADLPPGWAVEPDDDDTGPSELCGERRSLKSLVGVEAVSKAEAQCAEGGSIPLLFHLVGAFAPGEAEVAIDKTRALFSGCTTLTLDTGQKLKIAPVSFASLGDESVPLLFTGEVEGFTFGIYLLIVRVADGLTVVGYGGLAPDIAEAERFARLATDKLRTAQGSP